MYEAIMDNAESIKAVEGGYELGSLCFLLNSECGDRVFKVSLDTGTINLAVFIVDARHEQEALDRVIDFCEENEYDGLFSEYTELEEEAYEEDMDVEEYIEECNLTCGGNSCLYVGLRGIEEL